MAKKYAIAQIPYMAKTVIIDGVEWQIGNSEFVLKHLPAEIPGQPHLRVGLFSYNPDDQFVQYIPLFQIHSIKIDPVPDAWKEKSAELSLIEGYEMAGYKDWSNPIDIEVLKEPSICECCARKTGGSSLPPMKFKGFKKGTSRVAIAICPYCGNQFEF